jgi:hypothetical protein
LVIQPNHFILLMAETMTLLHGDDAISVDMAQLKSCGLLTHKRWLLASPYRVRSQVSAADLLLFVNAIQGSDPDVTHENCRALKLLCDEFGFTRLRCKVQAFIGRRTSLVFQGQTVHIECDKLVRTCSKFCDDRSLLTQPYHVTSLIRSDVFRAFVDAINGIPPKITNKNVTDIRLLCLEFGHEGLLATVAEFLAHHSSPGECACRKIVALKAQNAALAAKVADLAAQSSRGIALPLAVAVKLFGAKQFLAETVGLETNADQLGEMIGSFCPGMTWNEELDAVRK